MAPKSARYNYLFAVLLALTTATAPAFAASDLEQGISLYNARDYAGAKLCFDRVTRTTPTNWQAQYYLGHCNYALGQMPQARYAYQMAMHHSLHPAVKAQCQAGLDNVDKYKSQTLKSNNSATVAIASKVNKDDAEEEADLVPDPNSPTAKAEKAKAEIMLRAREEISKIRKAAQEQIQFESENSNTICKYPDGHKALDIPYQRVDAINAEAEEKCTKIMNDAEARCRGYH